MKQDSVPVNNSEKLVDQFSRTISYLRLSLTDKCNLRCLYCMPCEEKKEGGRQNVLQSISSGELLTYEELERIVSIAVNLGMSKLRLTGGEPLLRRGVVGFIERLSKIKGLEQIRLTTNGVLLKEKAPILRDLGIHHLNISLDTLNKTKFKQITGRDYFLKVAEGIDSAIELGFRVKLNVVAMKGVNDDEIIDFANLSLNKPLQVRFIEFMPVGKGSIWDKEKYISAETIRNIIADEFSLEIYQKRKNSGPARMYDIFDANGRSGQIGFISPISHHFCDQCNRLRLTSEGKLRSCLLHDGENDLKQLLRDGGTDADVEKAIRNAILFKPKGHDIALENGSKRRSACQVRMSRIGG